MPGSKFIYNFLRTLFLWVNVVNDVEFCYSIIEWIIFFSQLETTYVYTPCDDQGNRWKVQIPRQPGVCRITKPVAPAAGVKCSKLIFPFWLSKHE